MPLLRNARWYDDDPWHLVEPNALTSDEEEFRLFALAHYLHLADHRALPANAGLVIAPDDDVTRLSGYLHRVPVVAIHFPTYTDGRGYTHARRLRRSLGYTGELRAIGDVRPDQLLEMVRVGFDAFSFDDAPDRSLVARRLEQFTHFYQPSYPLAIAG